MSIISMAMIIIIQIVIIFELDLIVSVFTRDPDVAEMTSSSLIIIVLMFMPDMIQGSLQGVIRALNVQKRASIIAIASHYMVSLPLALMLAFVFGMGVNGLWIGVTFGVMLEAIFYVRLVIYTDWQAVSNEALERLENDKAKTLLSATASTLEDSGSENSGDNTDSENSSAHQSKIVPISPRLRG